MKLVDTSVLVDHLRGHGVATALLEGLVESGERVVTSELSRFELLAGARPHEHGELEQVFAALDWVPVNEAIARGAGEYARTYRRSHSGIGAVDYLLAATATLLGAELLTTNVRHFPMFDALTPPY
ncbi:MAG TPA: type II toxin-antitoxin system VapC family toxin [Actinomycetales bacterium]|nr:type II toxin-antitoxin system VapC family toxin [Actinomycetales bacterium]